MNDDEVRASAFARWFDERMGARESSWDWGSVLAHRGFPGSSDLNFVRLDARAGADPEAAAADVARLRDAAPTAWRRVVVGDGALAERVTPAFERAGWRAERYALMVRRRSAVPGGTLPPAGRVTLEAYLDHRASLRPEDPVDRERADAVDRAIGTSCFLARLHGEPAGGCVSWRHGTDVQIDQVETSPGARGRGVATAAVAAAVDAAEASGATWIHLYTRADTGPIALYQRLGFDVAGSTTELVR